MNWGRDVMMVLLTFDNFTFADLAQLEGPQYWAVVGEARAKFDPKRR